MNEKKRKKEDDREPKEDPTEKKKRSSENSKRKTKSYHIHNINHRPSFSLFAVRIPSPNNFKK